MKILQITPSDNVAVALENITAGEVLQNGVTAQQDIKKGHKVAVSKISSAEKVIKYGFAIGVATCDINPGYHVHTHNVKTGLDGVLEYSYNPVKSATTPTHTNLTFKGYRRKNGSVGIRNEIWIINTVGCVNRTSELIAKEATARFGDKIDGVFAFPHPFGCSQMGDDQLYTQKALAGLARHPNAGGTLVLGLGCENNNIPEFVKVLGEHDLERFRFLSTQQVSDEVETALTCIAELVELMQHDKRVDVPISELVVGLKCGGSDGFSGITANPLVGAFSDMLVSSGGTTLLTEVPEMFGAETILMDRAVNSKVFEQVVDLINNFKNYYTSHNQTIYENPSPGNKEGGISTLEDKSLGCTQKGGTMPVVGVLDYAQKVQEHGLNLVYGPGNDIVSCTNMVACGAHIVLFTTGRGTPLGAPAPTIKISSNTDLFLKKPNWIDFDAGVLLGGEKIGDVASELMSLVVSVANGEKLAKNELNGYREISIFKDGVTL